VRKTVDDMAKKSLLDTIKPAQTAEELDKIAEQIHSAGKKPKSALPHPADGNEQHRLTIDLPKWLVAAIKSEGKKNGLTAKGVILSLLLEKFKS